MLNKMWSQKFLTVNTVFSCSLCDLGQRSLGKCRVYYSALTRSREHYFIRAIDVDFHVEFKVMWGDEWKHNFTNAGKHPKHYDVDWEFGFHHYRHFLWWHSKPAAFVRVHHLIKVENLLRKCKGCPFEGNAYACSKAFQHGFSFSLHCLW